MANLLNRNAQQIKTPRLEHETRKYIEAELTKDGLRLSNFGEAGWYYNVLDLNGECLTVWCTDEPMPIEEIE